MGEDPEESQGGAELCKCGAEATNRGHSLQRFATKPRLELIVVLSLSSRGRHGTGEGGEGPHLYRSPIVETSKLRCGNGLRMSLSSGRGTRRLQTWPRNS